VLKLDGTFLFMFGSKDGQMIYPCDVAVNQLDDRIAVTDTGNHRLASISELTGEISCCYGSGGT